jgi:hypothetical protein
MTIKATATFDSLTLSLFLNSKCTIYRLAKPAMKAVKIIEVNAMAS